MSSIAHLRGSTLQQLVLVALLAILSLPSPSAAQASLPTAAPQKPAPAPQRVAVADYVIGPGDVLSINVFGHADLSTKSPVQADGTLMFPQLGVVKAGGRTVQDVEKEITERLGKQYVRNPQLAVSVDQYRSQQVSIVGQVRAPGTFQFTGSMRLYEALAKAGGTGERAGPEALIVREADASTTLATAGAQPANPNPIRIDLDALIKGDPAQNIALRAGDVITVPVAESIFVTGKVARPNEYGFRRDMTVNMAITLAGGFAETGSQRRIQIKRKVNGKDTTIDVKLEDMVQPGDTINVRPGLL